MNLKKRLSQISKTLSQILKRDYIGTILLTLILFGSVFAFWFGLRLALQTEFPFLAVASGSMEPFLYEGDLIIVQGGLNFAQLNAAPEGAQPPGEVIVFYQPGASRPTIYWLVAGEVHLIVHRAVNKTENNGTWYFQTKGDNNQGPDRWSISEREIVGRVVGKVPWVGHIPLFMHRNPILVTLIIGSLFVFLILMDFIFPQKEDEETRGQEEKLLNITTSKKRVPKNR